jgi:pyruvate/2-oxoglutarate dehydrogenase complex dihydrolipoamide acyltransferase (E2) component
VEDKNSAVETVSRDKATSEPGSVGAPMSGVVVEVRVKEAQEIKKGDPLCGKWRSSSSVEPELIRFDYSPQCHEGKT